ncbi:MAG: hypothetical protein GWP06_13005 [Actinobacteria bacterium]|nr:hypothetical protein [Actinomycetota bacterium]
MKIALYIFVVILGFAVFSTAASAQTRSVEIEIMQQHLVNFEYDSVVTMAEKMLADKSSFSVKELLEIYRMKAIAHYSLLEMNAALNSFVEILKINPDYSLDPVRTSPKIVKFFNEIKSNFRQKTSPPETIQPVKTDTVKLIMDTGSVYRNTLIRSMLLPGWGHLYLQSRKKGWFLSVLSTAALGSAIYYIFDSRDKQKAYLNEIYPSNMDIRYNAYNRSYKTRNILISTYALLWLYSQTDILVFQRKNIKGEFKAAFLPTIDSRKRIGLSAHISF